MKDVSPVVDELQDLSNAAREEDRRSLSNDLRAVARILQKIVDFHSLVERGSSQSVERRVTPHGRRLMDKGLYFAGTASDFGLGE